MMNRATMIGRMGRDAEMRYSQAGKAMLKFSLAVDDGFGDKKTTTWVDVTVFGTRAESLEKLRLEKGTLLYVEGPVSVRTWANGAGETKASLQLTAFEVKLLSGRRDGERSAPSQGQRTQAPRAQSKPLPEPDYESDFGEDEIPF